MMKYAERNMSFGRNISAKPYFTKYISAQPYYSLFQIFMHSFLKIFALYLPFQIALGFLTGFDIASIRVFAIILFLFWAARGLLKNNLHFPSTLQTWFLFSFLFLTGLSIFMAQNTDWAWRKFVFLLAFFPIYFVFADTTAMQRKKILDYISISAFFAALIGIIQFFLQYALSIDGVIKIWTKSFLPIFLGTEFAKSVTEYPSFLVNISGNTLLRASSIFPDPHIFSLFLGIILPWPIFRAFETRSWKWMLVSIAIFAANILTFSRGGYVALIAGGMFYATILAINYSRHSSENSRHSSRSYGLFFAPGVILILLVLMLNSSVKNRLTSILEVREGSNQGRLAMWKQSTNSFLNNPLLGVGIGNFPLEVSLTASYREPINAHNTYLDIAAESGIFALFFWVSLIFAGILTLAKPVIPALSRNLHFPLNVGLPVSVSLTIFATHSLFETTLYSVHILPLFLILIALSNPPIEK